MRNNFFKSAIGAMILLAAVLPAVAHAATFKADPSGVTVVNEAVNDDLYSAGSNVTVSAPVSGDAILAGGTVFIDAPVSESVLAAGGTITVVGDVGDDVRALGANLSINGIVAHDVVVVGGQVNIAYSATVRRDLIVLGGTVTVNGAVNGNVYVRGGDVTINGPIAGSVNVTARTLAFGKDATVAGDLTYSSLTPAVLAPGLIKGQVQYKKMENNAASATNAANSFLAFGLAIKLASMFVLTLIAISLFKKRAYTLTQNAFTKFGWDILHGFSTLVIMPIAALVLLVTVLGAPLAMLVMAVYVILLILASVLATLMVGGWIWRLFKKTGDFPVNTYTVIIGVLAYVLLGALPVLGWLFDAVFMLAALGTLTRTVLAGLDQTSKHK